MKNTTTNDVAEKKKSDLKSTVGNYVPRISTQILVIMALMVAIQMVLERFFAVFETPFTRLSFTFVGRAVSGAILGPFYSAIVGVTADVLGWFIKQSYPFNPGITFAAALRGVTFGIFLFRKQRIPNILAAAFCDQFIAGLIVTTLSLYWFSGIPLTGETILPRLIQCASIFVLEVIFLLVTKDNLFKQIKKFMSSNVNDRI
jgi:ECF transporter S component (folate family)